MRVLQMADKCYHPTDTRSALPIWMRLSLYAGTPDGHTAFTAADGCHYSSPAHKPGEVSASAWARAHGVEGAMVRECAHSAALKHTAYCYPPELLADAVSRHGPASALISRAKARKEYGVYLPTPAWRSGHVLYYDPAECAALLDKLHAGRKANEAAKAKARAERSRKWKAAHYKGQHRIRDLPVGISRHGNKFKASIYGAAGKRQIYCGLHATMQAAILAQDKVRGLLGIKKEKAA